MATTSLELSRTFASFAGVDIRVTVDGITVGALQALSYAVQREKAPIYVMGQADPLSFSRGKRGIAGTLICLMLDKHILYKEPFRSLTFVADNDELFPSTTDIQSATPTADLGTIGTVNFQSGDISDNYTVSRPWYVDQMTPFDVVIIGANEYGNAASMRIYGLEILNEGSGFSVDDIVVETQMTYVCRTLLPWAPLGQWDMSTVGGAFTAVPFPPQP